MAAIGSIRKHSFLLVFLIGASIVGFLIMDATNSQFSVLKGRKDSIGKVNGEKISYSDFSKKFDENVKNMETQMRGMAIGDNQRNMIRTQTWNEMVSDIIFKKIYERLGINVTGDEMNELAMGENASPYIKQDQQFKNPQTGQFDPSLVRLYLGRLDQDPEGVEPGTVRKQWLRFETNLKQNEYQQKYNNLISKGFYVPSWMAEMAYNDQSRTVDLRYVQLPYSDVNDADVKVTDDDLKKYMEDHPDKYKEDEETRKLGFVSFDIAASASDSAKMRSDLLERRAEFAQGEKASDDSVFVKIYSDVPFDEVYYDKDKLASPVRDSFFMLPVKSIVGPYVDGNSYKLAKISDRKMISDSVHVREIKISFEGINSQDAANIKFRQLDSIYHQIDSLKGDFGVFAAAFSDDPVGKLKRGDIGWVKQGAKDKYYNDLIFYRAQKGRTYKVPSQTENAIYLVQVVEDRPSKQAVQVAYLAKEIVPSAETERSIYANATSFAADNQNEAKFLDAAKKLNIKTVEGLKKEDFTLNGLTGSARDLIKWAFNAKKGDISPVFTVDKKHVVAILEQVRPKGIEPLDAVRDAVRSEVVKDKKFALLSKKISDAKAASVDDLAAKLGKTAMQADRASFANPSLNGMFEPKVVATALATGTGKVSQPVEGNSGVFVVQTIAVQEPAKVTDFSMYTMSAKQQLQGKSRKAEDVERKLAKIDDNRFDFF